MVPPGAARLTQNRRGGATSCFVNLGHQVVERLLGFELDGDCRRAVDDLCDCIASQTQVSRCVSVGRYLDWPADVTARATALGVEATPTVLVEGTAVRPDDRAITAAVAAAHRAP